MKDSQFIRGKVPMTKEEVRTIILSKLELKSDDNFMDIGAGTGSVSIEAALKAPNGKVIAIEHKQEAVDLIAQNCKKHEVGNLNIVHGKAPIGMDNLEAIDKFFIGGSGGNLTDILERIDQHATDNTIIVTSAIVVDTFIDAYQYFKSKDYELEVIQVSVNRIDPEKKVAMLIANNPIFILTAKKQQNES
ncbi:precorrin-6Y C5,15-methyltransferase (decarboxylating) subunit CbiT [Prolixibacteraceae bacterium JC049]|nr:precorrin-6Y C5,15-methyltransferase (decarboxylating) subunit CbiT [Prolixibacteraceae bacterium JC049]